MKRISTATAVQNRFVDGNKSTGQKATQFSAEWCNQIQEEIAGLLEANGVTLGASENQLVALFSKVFASGFNSIHMSKDGSTMDADGEKLIVTKSTQGGNYTAKLDKDGVMVGFPTIGYIRYGLRKIEFLAADGTTKVGEFSLDGGKFKLDKSVDVTGDIGTSGNVVSGGKVVSSGKEVNSYGNTVPAGGSYFSLTDSELVIASAPGQSGRKVFHVIFSGSGYDMTGIGTMEAVKVVASEHAVGSEWKIGLNGGLAFKNVSGSSESTVARFVGKDFEMLEGFIRGKNTILATSNVDLTSSAYSSIAAGTELTVVNNGSSTISVTYASGATAETIDSSSARKYVKKTSGFARLLALDPTATHP